jgi:hypothetical protein
VAPADAELHPAAVTADQVTFTPTVEQMSNAKAIVAAGQAMGLPPRAWVIAVATSLQESQLKNIGDLGAANDHDSLGLFQQRPSSGWGTPEQIQDPIYSATAFYKGLVDVPGWQSLPLTQAARRSRSRPTPTTTPSTRARPAPWSSPCTGRARSPRSPRPSRHRTNRLPPRCAKARSPQGSGPSPFHPPRPRDLT